MSIEDISKLLEYIEGNLKPKDKEKKERGEVFTPISLIEEMLDKLPSEVWNNPNLKWLDPAAGIGNFPIVIYLRLMKGLSEDIPDEEARRRHILEKMLFMVEINPNNVSTLNRIFCGDKYCLNIFEGSFIDGNDIDGRPYERVFNPKMEFDVVVGNPPYNKGGTGTGNSIWPLFVSKSLKILKQETGYLTFIHPSGWRKPESEKSKYRGLFKLLTSENQMIYLEMHGIKDGQKTFKCGTRFDWYLLQKTKLFKDTTVKDEIGNLNENVNMGLYPFLPNFNINLIQKILAKPDENIDMIHINLINKVSNLNKKQWNTLDIKKALYQKPNKKICTQRIRKSHIENGDIKEDYDETYKYKIIDKINKGHPFPGIYYYNNYKMLDYGKPKIIMCSGGYLMPSLDKEGVYNISDNMLYILINDLSEYEGLTILINSLLFKYLNKVTMTDSLHGRDLVIKNIKNITLNNIKCENDIYSQLNITNDELELIKNTIFAKPDEKKKLI